MSSAAVAIVRNRISMWRCGPLGAIRRGVASGPAARVNYACDIKFDPGVGVVVSATSTLRWAAAVTAACRIGLNPT
ncbi:hypothetical protein AKJ09_05477 [Labilithrix luteola]|uniref:Uncharacterized protein n=1 Tax=Labilithrix luteola TaxID=1391654 RepID=A0A0K1PZ66_9BACT|nr:hypothetical protein AKJ09_05477 [Labilithrix luteola]